MKLHIYFYKKITTRIFLIFIVLLSFSCDKFLDLEEPSNQISSTTVFKDKKLALAALSDIYANLRSNSLLNGGLYGSGTLLACYTDELVPVTSQALDFKTFYDLGVVPVTPVIDNLWINAYKQIYAVNNLIQGLQNSVNYIDEPTRNQFLGEALCIRGLLHFYLTNLYGNIPYVITTDYQQNAVISKLPTAEIYQKIENDYIASESLLTATYSSPNKTRINKSAVQILLARLYLYSKNWTKAKEKASEVIQSQIYPLETNINKTFLKDATSTIWQFAAADVGFNTLEGQYYIFNALPPSNVVLSQNLLDSFEQGDQRKILWTKTLSNSQMSYTHPFKYKQYTKTATSQEFSVVLRVEEAYLILAEAYNELGDFTNSLLYINTIRQRIGLQNIVSSNQNTIRNIIMEERRHEFFTEFGHRFFDLKRGGLLTATMQSYKTSWQNYMITLPLPERELQANKNLKPQNEGY